MECQRTALSTSDPNVRLRYLHLAKLWREMAREAERRAKVSFPSEGAEVVLFPKRFQKDAEGAPGSVGATYGSLQRNGVDPAY